MLEHMLIFKDIIIKMAQSGESFLILGKLILLTINVIRDLMLDTQLAA